MHMMDQSLPSVRIVHLYPDLLNLYGDRGNLIALQQRCRWRGIDCSVIPVTLGDSLDLETCDLVFIGGGQAHEQNLMREDLLRRRDALVRAAADDLVVLGICGGYQMLGRYFEEPNGRRIEGLGVLDCWTIGHAQRLIGDMVCHSDCLAELQLDPVLVGFENHSGRTYLGSEVRPLARVISGSGNNDEDGTEGAVWKHVFGTYLHGSFLPKNPAMADLLLRLALERRAGRPVELVPLNDTLAQKVRQQLVGGKSI